MTDDMNQSAFDQLVGLLDYPMFVVTTRAGDELAGCLLGFASQVSITPSRFLAALSNKNHTFRVALRATHLAVHLLPRERADLARLFGSETGDQVNKFDRCAWHPGPAELPILSDAVGWFAGSILNRFELGDHVGFLLEPTAGQAPEQLGEIVSLADVRDLDPGHDA